MSLRNMDFDCPDYDADKAALQQYFEKTFIAPGPLGERLQGREVKYLALGDKSWSTAIFLGLTHDGDNYVVVLKLPGQPELKLAHYSRISP